MSEKKSGFLNRKEKRKFQKSNKSTPYSISNARRIVTKYKLSTVSGENREPIKLKLSTGQPVDGFYFKYENGLKEMLMNNEMKGFYLAVGELDNGGHTLVLYGVTDDKVVMEESTNLLKLHQVDDQIYDLCDPCPNRCPVNL